LYRATPIQGYRSGPQVINLKGKDHDMRAAPWLVAAELADALDRSEHIVDRVRRGDVLVRNHEKRRVTH
jgi:prophage antirepressor-like protein